MHERLDQWQFVVAAIAIGVIGTLLMIGVSLYGMARAERRREAARGSGPSSGPSSGRSSGRDSGPNSGRRP